MVSIQHSQSIRSTQVNHVVCRLSVALATCAAVTGYWRQIPGESDISNKLMHIWRDQEWEMVGNENDDNSQIIGHVDPDTTNSRQHVTNSTLVAMNFARDLDSKVFTVPPPDSIGSNEDNLGSSSVFNRLSYTIVRLVYQLAIAAAANASKLDLDRVLSASFDWATATGYLNQVIFELVRYSFYTSDILTRT
jgi:hypothetical protein